MPTQSTERQIEGLAGAIGKVQGDLFGVDPRARLEAKSRLQRAGKWLRELRQNNADIAQELITLNAVAAKDCFARRDFEGLARHSSLVLTYTLPRLNATLIPGAAGPGGAVIMQWQATPDDLEPGEPAPDANVVEG